MTYPIFVSGYRPGNANNWRVKLPRGNIQLCISFISGVMPKPFVPDYERKTVPVLPMVAISFVTFLGNMCYSLVNPNIPYMTKQYFPDVSF